MGGSRPHSLTGGAAQRVERHGVDSCAESRMVHVYQLQVSRDHSRGGRGRGTPWQSVAWYRNGDLKAAVACENQSEMLEDTWDWEQLSFFRDKFIYFNWRLITLQCCSGFAIHWCESTTGVYAVPILNPHPPSLPIPSLWIIPAHRPRAPCLLHRTWTGDSFHIW